jgi:hypothetical protein
MRKLTALVVVLTAMTSCKKECYKFRCEQTSQYKNSIGTPIGGNVSLTSYEEYKCELTKKEADRYLIYLNGEVTTEAPGGMGNTITVVSDCSKIIE